MNSRRKEIVLKHRFKQKRGKYLKTQAKNFLICNQKDLKR